LIGLFSPFFLLVFLRLHVASGSGTMHPARLLFLSSSRRQRRRFLSLSLSFCFVLDG
jgi:hypothetical protein